MPIAYLPDVDRTIILLGYGDLAIASATGPEDRKAVLIVPIEPAEIGKDIKESYGDKCNDFRVALVFDKPESIDVMIKVLELHKKEKFGDVDTETPV